MRCFEVADKSVHKRPHCNIWTCRDVARFSRSIDSSMSDMSEPLSLIDKSVQQNIYISVFYSKYRSICTCISMQHISDNNCKKLQIESAYSTCMLQQLILLLLLSNEHLKIFSKAKTSSTKLCQIILRHGWILWSMRSDWFKDHKIINMTGDIFPTAKQTPNIRAPKRTKSMEFGFAWTREQRSVLAMNHMSTMTNVKSPGSSPSSNCNGLVPRDRVYIYIFKSCRRLPIIPGLPEIEPKCTGFPFICYHKIPWLLPDFPGYFKISLHSRFSRNVGTWCICTWSLTFCKFIHSLAAIASGITYQSNRWCRNLSTFPFRLVCRYQVSPYIPEYLWISAILKSYLPLRSSNVKLLQQSYSNHTTTLWCLWVIYGLWFVYGLLTRSPWGL